MFLARDSFGHFHGGAAFGSGRMVLPPALSRRDLAVVHSYCGKAKKTPASMLRRAVADLVARIRPASPAKG